MRVCVDATLEPGPAGWVVQGLLGFVYGLSRLDPGPEEYRLLVRPGRGDWLRPYIGELPLLEAVRPKPPLPPSLPRRVAARVRRAVRPTGAHVLPPSRGAAEAFGADVLHLPTQQGFATRIPTLYHPWDLQHLHFPEFFEDGERRHRNLHYRALCRQARVVVAPTRWVAEDLIENLEVPRRKVAVIPEAAPLSVFGEPSDADVARVRAAFDLPELFALFPANTWPHKNHLALVDALARLNHEGMRIQVVCPGWLTDFHPTIERRAREAGIAGQLRFPGYLQGLEIAVLYRLARVLVFPSLFEGWGFPVAEAFAAGVPVACSDAPSAREVAGGAAAMFDPNHPDELAAQLRRVWSDEALRRELADRGREQSRRFSWERTARICRAHYRQIAGLRLDAEDRSLVQEAAA
jgi:glycosyltransferase involved in cell wall biosynthesis